MSEEQLKAFIAKVQADTSLQEQLKAEGADVVSIAKAVGFAITSEDIATHNKDRNPSNDELQDVTCGALPNEFVLWIGSTELAAVPRDPGEGKPG